MPPESAGVLLFVEDDPADARLIKRALEKVQFPASIVHLDNGDDAVDYIAGEGKYADRNQFPKPWLVLLDIKLPRRSGIEVLQWLRQQPGEVASTPVVMFTSSSHAVDVNTAYHHGANSYLVKPESSSQLVSVLNVLKTYWFMHSQLPQPE